MRKEEKGRDNRHSRHIKTRQGDTTRRAAQHRQSRRAVGPHNGASSVSFNKKDAGADHRKSHSRSIYNQDVTKCSCKQSQQLQRHHLKCTKMFICRVIWVDVKTLTAHIVKHFFLIFIFSALLCRPRKKKQRSRFMAGSYGKSTQGKNKVKCHSSQF